MFNSEEAQCRTIQSGMLLRLQRQMDVMRLPLLDPRCRSR